MQYHLRQVGVFLDLHIMNRPEVMVPEAQKLIVDGVLVDESTKKFLKKHLDAFVRYTVG